jgi:hypothetical protein
MSNPVITQAEVQALKSSGGRLVAKGNKYGVAPKADRTYNGIVYDSKAEAQFASRLDLWKKVGTVVSWRRQIPLELLVKGVRICKLIVDFDVTWRDEPAELIELKGVETPVYKLKIKLARALYGPNIIKVLRPADLKRKGWI